MIAPKIADAHAAVVAFLGPVLVGEDGRWDPTGGWG